MNGTHLILVCAEDVGLPGKTLYYKEKQTLSEVLLSRSLQYPMKGKPSTCL